MLGPRDLIVISVTAAFRVIMKGDVPWPNETNAQHLEDSAREPSKNVSVTP
jgi:hypothetical protein